MQVFQSHVYGGGVYKGTVQFNYRHGAYKQKKLQLMHKYQFWPEISDLKNNLPQIIFADRHLHNNI